MSDALATGSVTVERTFPEPPEEVFAAWTTPASMAVWLSPIGHAEVVADVRVGGTFTVVMVGDGQRIEHTGEYLEVEPPHRLRFTWRSPYTGPRAGVVTVELRPVAEGTALRLTHTGLPPEAAESHRGGWGAILDRLTATLGAEV